MINKLKCAMKCLDFIEEREFMRDLDFLVTLLLLFIDVFESAVSDSKLLLA